MLARLSVLTAAVAVGSCALRSSEIPQASPISLASRTAGAPERCILIQPAESFRVSQSNHRALVYGKGRTIWINRLAGQCSFKPGDTLVTEPIGSSHCRGDRVRSFDNFTHIPGNSCILGDFVPYRQQP